jgi:hypothetical protein
MTSGAHFRRHCEDRQLRSNPDCHRGDNLDCFACARNDARGRIRIPNSGGQQASTASWFETALARLLTMRVCRRAAHDHLMLRSALLRASRRMSRTKNDDTSPPSRGARRPSFALTSPSSEEGAGKARCPPHPWSACSKKARGRTTGTSRSNRPSLRNGFTAYTYSPR